MDSYHFNERNIWTRKKLFENYHRSNEMTSKVKISKSTYYNQCDQMALGFVQTFGYFELLTYARPIHPIV